MLGTSARRLFFSVRPPSAADAAVSRQRNSSSSPIRRRLCCAALPAAVRRKGKGKGKEKQAATEDDHRHDHLKHLKRRTRSVAAFDRELYRRYEGGGHHAPVMLGEVLQAFHAAHLRSFVDCTLGSAGHSAAILDAHTEMEVFIGLDVDPSAHDLACPRIKALLSSSNTGLKAYTHVRNFKYIKSVLGGVDENLLHCGVDGILIDLGMSSMQVNHSERGFSVLANGPLDMRMDPQASLKAQDILNDWPEAEVGRILCDYGEENNWRYLQKMIVDARSNGGLNSTGELVDLIKRTSARSGGRQGWIKTATRIFQALRIAVNDELQTLEDALYACFDSLSSGGRLVVISFHSLEDRIVKKTFIDLIDKDNKDGMGENCSSKREDEIGTGDTWCQNTVQGDLGTILTKRPITPSQEEERLNRRCRSAKMRVIQKG